MLPEFDLVTPGSLAEALAALRAEGTVPLAGGTNLLVEMRIFDIPITAEKVVKALRDAD